MRSIKFGLFAVLFLFGFFSANASDVWAGGTLTPDQCHNNCEGIINNALSTGGTVYLKAGEYVVDGKMRITQNGTTLTGDQGAKIKLIDQANWPREESGNGAIIEAVGVSNIRITGFEIDGNRSNNTTSVVNGTTYQTPCGRNFYSLLYFYRSSDVEIDHMFLHHNWNDIVKYRTSSNLKFHDNNVRQPGHDIVYGAYSVNVAVYNNYMRIYCNSGARCDTCDEFYVYNNNIARDEGAGGNAAVELQGGSPNGGPSDVYVCSNTISNVRCVYDLQDGKSCWTEAAPNNPFNGTIHTSGCPASGSPEFPPGDGTDSGSTGGGGDAGGDTGGSGGDTGGSSGGGSTTPSWNPSGSILDDNPYSNIDPALPSSERDLNSLYPKLGNAPATATNACSSVPNSAGFIPCGRNMDDPATSWNECNECSLCSMVLMGQLTVEFLIKVAAVAATLALIFAGFIYVFAAGREDLISRSKSMIKYTLMGFIIIFIAWAIIDTVLMTLGYIDPIGGEWHSIC